jgi:hypothetical protein
MNKETFKRKIFEAQDKINKNSIANNLISEIKEIYEYAENIDSTIAEGLIEIEFTLSGTCTSFEEVEGDMDNIADAYGLLVSDFNCFYGEDQGIDCDEYLRTGQPVEFCVSFEYLE